MKSHEKKKNQIRTFPCLPKKPNTELKNVFIQVLKVEYWHLRSEIQVRDPLKHEKSTLSFHSLPFTLESPRLWQLLQREAAASGRDNGK